MNSSPLTLQTKEEIKRKTAKPLLYIAIGSIVMLFSGLTSAYIVSMSETKWIRFDLPLEFWFSTGVILLSSLTMNMAVSAAQKDQTARVKTLTLVTLLLGFGFVFFQFAGWNTLVSQNIFFAGKKSNAAGSYIYAITGLHLLHLVGGLISLIVCSFRASAGKYTSSNHLGLQLAAIYWHFLDLLWVLLFIFFLVIR